MNCNTFMVYIQLIKIILPITVISCFCVCCRCFLSQIYAIIVTNYSYLNTIKTNLSHNTM